MVLGLALLFLDLAAVASAVSEPVRAVEAVAFAPAPPPPLLLAANAPPVAAKIRAMKAMKVLGVRCFFSLLNISCSFVSRLAESQPAYL